jgi:hypothetical protein
MAEDVSRDKRRREQTIPLSRFVGRREQTTGKFGASDYDETTAHETKTRKSRMRNRIRDRLLGRLDSNQRLPD